MTETEHMLQHTATPGFNAWWNSLTFTEQASINKYMARRAYIAGMRAVPDPLVKTPTPVQQAYRFRAGKWRVTVKATSLKAARVAAINKLDQRAEELGAKAPAIGWSLVRLPA